MKFEEACNLSNQKAARRETPEESIVCDLKNGKCIVREYNTYQCDYKELPEGDDWIPLPDKL